jgi:hypothetical protein
MRSTGAWIAVSLGIVSLPALAQERSWTREMKDRAKRESLHDASQLVRGDSGKWNDEPRLQHAPPIGKKPAKLSLDDWADQLLSREFQPNADDDSWLIFRTKQLDDNDRVWVERIERRENRLTVVAHQARWQGRYQKTFTYYSVIAVNLGKLEPGKYDVQWVIKPAAFTQFEGDGRPTSNNWPKDERLLDQKPVELNLALTIGKGSR